MSEPSLEPLPEGIAERHGIALPAQGHRLRGADEVDEVLAPLAALDGSITVLFSLTRAARGLSWNPDCTARLIALDDVG